MKYLVLGLLLLSGTVYAGGSCNGHSNCTEVIVNKAECDTNTADLVCSPTLTCDVDTIIQGVLQGIQLRELNEPCEKCRKVYDCAKIRKVHGQHMQRCWILAE